MFILLSSNIMKKILYLISILLLSFSIAEAQYLSSFQFLRTLNFAQIDSMYTANGIPTFLFQKRFNVNIYKVIYNTVSFDSSATTASGALLLPVNPPCNLPLVSYQHGTETLKLNVPSHLGGELPVGVALSSDGYAACLPDYIGLGDNPVQYHPYLHAQSEATATIDMIRASRELIDSLGFGLNGQLFLAGYSQGGHATLAAQKIMEEQLPSEFTITASLPMSGPYDLSGSQARVIEVDSVFSASVYLPYIIFAYDEVYNLWPADSDVLISPYDVTLRPLFNGQFNLLQINNQLPPIPNDILQPLLLDSFINDSNHYVRQALRENDLTDWTPVSPTKIMYCTADEQVVYQNSIVAYNKFIQNGSTSVQLINSGATLSHLLCANVSFVNGKAWFDTLRTDYIISDLTVVDESFSGALDGQISVNILGGVPPYTILWSNGAGTAVNAGLSAGTYVLTVTDSVGCARIDTIQVGLTTSVFTVLADQSHIKYFPNPATNQLMIKSDTPLEGNVSIQLYDAQGRKLLSFDFVKELNLNVSTLTRGLYFIQVVNETGSLMNGRLLVD